MAESTPVVVVTGAADGIGWAVARRFDEEGYTVVLCDRDGDKVIERAAALGARHMPLAMDVTDEAAVVQGIAASAQRFGAISALVNNAGIGSDHLPTVDQTLKHFQDVLRVHLDGTFLVSREVGRVMLSRSGGAIVNMSSIAALQGMPRRNSYAAAKAGIAVLTKDLACEWAHANIRVNAVAPGFVYTELVKTLERNGKVDVDRLRRRTPIGRLGEPSEIADAVFFLCSDRASYITGQVLGVDGGWAAFGDSGDAFSMTAG